jgi:hypothetical protein
MPINQNRLKNAILDAIDQCQQETEDANAAKDIFASAIANAVVTEMTSATVIGTCPSSGGPLTGGKLQ